MPGVQVIDISNDSIAGASSEAREQLKLLLSKCQGKVVLMDNRVMTNKEFLATLEESDWSKLVWIPKEWVNADGWLDVLSPKCPHIEVIRHAHEEHYP